MRYEIIDSPANGATGQHCGTFALADLPARIQVEIRRDPEAKEWSLPALSGGDYGEPLEDLTVIIREAD